MRRRFPGAPTGPAGAQGPPGTPITVGTTAPSSPNVGDLWFNTTAGLQTLRIWNGSAWQIQWDATNCPEAVAANVFAQLPNPPYLLTTRSLNSALPFVQSSNSAAALPLYFDTFVNALISNSAASVTFQPRNMANLSGRSGLICIYNAVATTYAWEAGTNVFDNNTAPVPDSTIYKFNLFSYSVVPTGNGFALRCYWTMLAKGITAS